MKKLIIILSVVSSGCTIGAGKGAILDVASQPKGTLIINMPEQYLQTTKNADAPDTLLSYISNDTLFIYCKPKIN